MYLRRSSCKSLFRLFYASNKQGRNLKRVRVVILINLIFLFLLVSLMNFDYNLPDQSSNNIDIVQCYIDIVSIILEKEN